MTADPWAGLAGPVAAPPWRGQVRVHVLEGEPLGCPPVKLQRKTARRARRRRVQLRPWMLLTPGGELEAAILATAPAAWWPFPHG